MASTIFAFIRKINIFAFECKRDLYWGCHWSFNMVVYGGVDVRVDMM
jgi:hypothetical protein